MATRNGERFIKEQLTSILAELTPYDEVIISDDSSSDDTLTVIRSFQDSRIRLLEGRQEKGIAKNFEASIAASTGDIIFLADQDDIWLTGKVNKMKTALEDYDLVMSDCQVVDENLKLRHYSFYDLNGSRKGLLRNLIKNSYMGCCMAFRSKLKARILPFPADIPIHDMWIGLIAEMYYNIYFMPDSLVMHRRHATNASTSGSSSRRTITHKLANRFTMIKMLLNRYYAD